MGAAIGGAMAIFGSAQNSAMSFLEMNLNLIKKGFDAAVRLTQ